jgi:hypothetical protein
MKKSKLSLISLILTALYLVYLIYYISSTGSKAATADSATQVGTAIGLALITPHLICTAVGLLMNALGYFLKKTRLYIGSSDFIYRCNSINAYLFLFCTYPNNFMLCSICKNEPK